MSFLEQLSKQRIKLKQTETVVTNVDGKRFREKGTEKVVIDPSSYGFVVDTKPDDKPVKIIDYLYIGSQDCTLENVLSAHEIKHVLSLGINIEVPVNHKFIEFLDLPETNIRPILEESIPYIKNAVEHKENILIHCNAGVSRTSAVCIAFLMHYKRWPFDEAFKFTKEKRMCIQPNEGFKKQLKMLVPGNIIKY